MNLPTAAGQARTSSEVAGDLVDAINQVFALFRVNYHNQYYKAFPDTETLNITKKLWLESLRQVPKSIILRTAEQLVRGQDYLPTLSQMLRCSRTLAGDALPDVHAAFVEACQAPSPKRNFAWSHPLVYHAGRSTGWHLLATEPERFTFPLFRKQFERLEQEYLNGDQLSLPEPDRSSDNNDAHRAVDAGQAKNHIAALRARLQE